MENKHGKYEKANKVDNRNDDHNIHWKLLSDEEKAKIKRKSMEKKAEIILKESKRRDDINAGRQRTQSNAWDTDIINDVSVRDNVQKVNDTKHENLPETVLDRIARKKRIRSGNADVADYWSD